ncbi:MAG TPA: BMP family ABC transporter substrate-binding protein [bacterium]|nr:BMP family ABC transporter substrate-binding protein [bacterium]
MKKRLIVFLVVLLGLVIMAGCAKKEEAVEATLRVGLVFDVGGRGDKSFNDSAYRGLKRAKEELGIYYEYIEPGEGSDRESGLRMLANQNFDLIFGIGFMFSDDITHVAREFPEKKFGGIDYTVQPGMEIPSNLTALKFREEEGSYLVGALAGLLTKTNKLGFVGGMEIPLIHKFESGYKAGVRKVNPKAIILVGYAGVTGEAFKNPAKGKELALSQYGQGVDIIYHVSGSTGLGVFEAAREKNALAIGVDSDQYHEAPGYILTSMIKRVDNSVYNTIKDTIAGQFKGGVHVFGLKEDGVGYIYDENNKDLIPDEVRKKVEELKREIIAGKIKVPRE